MISTDNHSITFTSKTFHWWPFSFFDAHYPGYWRGFIEQNNITLTDKDITISYSKNGKGEFSLPIKDLEYCINEKRIFSFRLSEICMGNTRVSIGIGEKDDRFWRGGNVSFDRFYVDFDEFDEFINALETKKPLCFSPETEKIETHARWYRIDQLINGNRNTLWLNDKHIISSESLKYGWCVKTDGIKYFFTRGIIFNNLYIGSEKNIRLSNVDNADVSTARTYIKNHGGNIAESTANKYTDHWTINLLFSPSAWFTHSSIDFTDKGIVYHQKTFKTEDDIFLPFEKVNIATYQSKWYWLFTKRFCIYGEQNIIPVKRYAKEDVDEIQEKLEAAGIEELQGEAYSPSAHNSWIGVFLSIITLSIYHWLVVAAKMLSKRNTLIIGDKKIGWDGIIYGFTAFENGYHREILPNLTTLVLDENDIYDVVYLKRHWYHIWGYVFIWAHPYNIRSLAGEAQQSSVDYDLEIKKIWSWQAHDIISQIEEKGFKRKDDTHEFYKKWCKHFMLDKYK